MSESREELELEKGFQKDLNKNNNKYLNEKELNKLNKKELNKKENKSFKERIKDFVCKIGIHFWKVNAIGKKKGKVVKLKKCEHCGMMK